MCGIVYLMDATRHPKKTSRGIGWHNAYIVAALHAGGTSLRKLSAEKGYSPTTLKAALHTPWPKAEQIIAKAIGEKPQHIWPDRYDELGKPLSGHGQRKALGQGKHVKPKDSTEKAVYNVEAVAEI